MNRKKSLPVVFVIVLAMIALALKRCNAPSAQHNNYSVSRNSTATTTNAQDNEERVPFDRHSTELYFTKHAKCRMQCREISEQEVKDILANGKVNYNKSNLNDPRGPTYAIEGMTNVQQHVRIIFAPKQTQLTVVTVIDLGVEHVCDCN